MSDGGYTPQPLPLRLRRAAAERGAFSVARDFAGWAARAAAGLPWTLAGSRANFDLGGERFPYLYHRYKRSWMTERAVEVPVAQAAVDRFTGRRVLEVGNVLSHYRGQGHVVVDKYERTAGVLNRDVLDLTELGQFDLVVAVSTIEHVGWDEQPRDPHGAVRALHALRRAVAPGGTLLVTVPAGYNPNLDEAIRGGALPGARLAGMRRADRATRWVEVPPAQAWAAPYDFLFYSARGVIFAWAGSDS